jgi:hypothetical protein
MPNTTNFNWPTPADTDLVKDGAAAIRNLGNGVDTSFLDLKGGTTNQVLAKNSNTDLDFKWVADASGIPATIFDAKGDLIAASAADTAARLAIGANGTVLTADSTESTGLKWVAPAGGGKVLQVVTATTTTSTTSTSTTWADTGLSASITPSSASSKILVMTSQSFRQTADQNYVYGGFRLQRDSTNIFGSNAASSPTNSVVYVASSAAFELNSVWNYSYLDSPSTTSSTTYKTQQAVQAAANNQTIISQFTSHPSSIILLEIGA